MYKVQIIFLDWFDVPFPFHVNRYFGKLNHRVGNSFSVCPLPYLLMAVKTLKEYEGQDKEDANCPKSKMTPLLEETRTHKLQAHKYDPRC